MIVDRNIRLAKSIVASDDELTLEEVQYNIRRIEE